MNMHHTKHTTIGADPRLTFAILNAVHDRRIRDAITARRRKRFARITGIDTVCRIVKKLLAKPLN